MFSKSIVLSDAFLDMPASTRCLYFTLSMFGDDDGFIDAPKGIMRQSGATEDDLKLLIAKKFIIPFDTGVVVIRHWRINNYLRNDRYTETKYLEEKSQLVIEKNGEYHSMASAEVIEEPKTQKIEVVESVPETYQEPKEEVGKDETSARKPLVEREPKNDLEKVEKAYLINYNDLYAKGCLRSAKPIINWTASRKLTNEVIKKFGVDTVVKAVKKSCENDFCISTGYSLTTILSTGVLCGLINGTSPPKKGNAVNRYRADMVSAEQIENIPF